MVTAVGTAFVRGNLTSDIYELELKDVYYAPDATENLFSTGVLNKKVRGTAVLGPDDAVLRLKAFDAPSHLSLHYSGEAEGPVTPFALEMRHFERESERCQFYLPQLAVARTQLLDYFGDLARAAQPDHLLFRFERSMELGPGEATLLSQLATNLGFPKDGASLAGYLTGENSAMLDLYPELGTFRDITFMFKAMMVPSGDALPELKAWTPQDAKLVWRFKPPTETAAGELLVAGFGKGTMHCAGWADDGEEEGELVVAAHPRKRLGFFEKLFKKAPKPRLPPSPADASSLAKQDLQTEEDVLHLRTKDLPDFGGTLRASDSELLLQYLLAPYLRVPLLLRFFSEASHTAALAHPELQDVLDAAIFEPGLWQPNAPKPMPVTVPAENRKHLATPVGLLFQELTHSPAVTLGCLQTLLDNALDMDAGRFSREGASAVILYAVRLSLSVEGYVRYLLSPAADSCRGLACSAGSRGEVPWGLAAQPALARAGASP